jgi:hypothetical protein
MSLAYLATPYTHYRGGLDKAHSEASRIAGKLLWSGVMVYSPIAHSHPLAIHGSLDPLEVELWYKHNELMMDRCDTLIVAHMAGWDKSDGIVHETNYFLAMYKPIFDLDPQSLSMKRRIGFPVAV